MRATPVIRILGAALLATATSAFAGGPLSVCNPGGGNAPVKYPGAGTVTLHYDLGNLGPRTKAQADALVTAAVGNWTNVTTSTVTLAHGTDLPVDVTTANSATYLGAGTFTDGLNPVVYDTDGSIVDQLLGAGAKDDVLGFAGSAFNGGTCQYLEGRAVINGFIPVSDVALRIVLAHEIGHLIGMDHSQLDDEQGLSQANYPLMYPIAFRATDVLHEDDVAAVTALYTEATSVASYGQVSGNLFRTDGVTPVRGANVWAREIATGKLFSIVSDYLQQSDGFFRLLLPPGTYELRAGVVRSGFTGGSSVGPYSETSGDLSFQPPLYNAGVPMAAVTLGGGTPTQFTITAGCAATATFTLAGAGSIGGNCGSLEPEVFPPDGVMPPDFVPGSSQQRDLFLNQGFESSFANWTATGSWFPLTVAPFSGTRHAQFSLANGTAANNLVGDLYQTVTIPSGITGAAVVYRLAVQTQETTTTSIFDELIFEVRTTAGTLLAEAPSHTNLDAGPYRPVGWFVDQFAGQTVRINFSAFTDTDLPTLFRLDDVSLIVEANPTWSVVSDQAQQGLYSLKSGATPDGFRSDLVHSADFVDGTVSFGRKVSSHTGDFLRFYIDEEQQGQWSGEVDWSTVSFPVAAGLHTLRWSYQKNLSLTAGADAAWIDNVSLPGVQGAMYLVTVGKSGAGSGTVSSSPGGIDCGVTCSASFLVGSITLTAVPGSGSSFSSWTGACAGQGAVCTLTLNGAVNTTAVFNVIPSYALTVTVSGNGTVTSSPAGINCPGDCSETYLEGTSVQLTAAAGSGAVFTGWSGVTCPGTGTCTVSMTAARSVTATFVTDTTPDAFTFTDATNVALGSVQTSNAITVAGITTGAAISVTGGTYSIGCTGTFTAVAGTITNGQTVCVRHTASASFSTATDTVLTIGGVSDTFTSTTLAADTTPGAFTFTDVSNVALGSVQTSNAITVTGINTAAAITVSGGTYSIGCTGTFTAGAGTIANAQTVCVQHTASGSFATATNTTLTIGGVSDTFTSTTLAADTTPNAFNFTDQANVGLGALVTSDSITVGGINTAAAISVTGGTYSIGCAGPFTAAAGTIGNGQTVCVQHTASGSFSTVTSTTLTIGGVSDTFNSTTLAADTTPNAFTFTDQSNVALSAVTTSDSITVGGINTAAAISVTGGTYSIGCTGTFTGTASTITIGQSVCVRHTASATPATATNTVLTIGGVSDTFTSTTVAADTTPDAFAFTDATNVALSSVQTSNAITVTGINTATAISVAGGTYSIGCTGTFSGTASTINNGQGVCVRHTASATPATATNTVLTIGGVSDTFTSTTVAADTTPDPFAFVDATNVALSSVQTSNTIVVAGINTAAAISVTGGTYSIGCTGTFTAGAGTITNGQGVCVRHTASATPATATDTVLTIGGVSDTFTSTTVGPDTTPDTFTFTDATNVALSSVQTSNAIIVAGINTAAPISVAGGTYSIGCNGTFTAGAGTVTSGQSVCVQHTASASFSTATNTTLTIGGVSDTFTSTTLAQDTTPDAFAFTDVTNVALSSVQTSNAITVAGINSPAAITVAGGTYSIGCNGTFTAGAGTISNGQTVCVRHTASATPATATDTVLTIGGVSDTFTSTTVGADTTPDAFTFTDVTNVALSSVQTSNAITVAGINTGAPISVTGGTYSIGCTGTFTASAGTINNGQSVCVRHTASATPATATNTVLTIGGVSDTFTSTTVGPDTTPDAFAFTDVTDVALGSVQTSNTIVVAGINTGAPISVAGGTYSIGCTGTFTGSAGTINNGQSVCVRHTGAATPATATNTTLTIGGVSDTFTSTTVPPDTTPDAFTFTDQANVALSAVVTSDTVTIGGINTAAPISVTGGTYSIGCTGAFTGAAGTINSGQTVCVRHTASATPATATNTVLTIGGVSDTFTSTTVAADTTPDALVFTDTTNVAVSSVQTSNAITVAGINTGAPVSVTGGTYSIGCTASFTAAPGTINNGQTVCVRHTASASFSTATNTTLTIGGVSDTFTSTTLAADTTPEPFSFIDATGVALGSIQTSNTITVSGINTGAPISVTGGTYSIGCTGTFTGVAGTINNAQTVCVRHTAAVVSATATDTVLTIGGVSDTFTSTTADTTPDAFTFTDATNVALSSVQTSNAITVAGINAAAPISVTGGTYSVGCNGTFTAAVGMVANGQTVCVRHTASASLATATNTVLTIGGVSDTFTSTTVGADTTPDAFSFTDVTNVATSSVQTSNAITVGSINTAAAISVTGGAYSIGCTGTFTGAAATIISGQTVCVRHTASATPATATNTVLTIGGVSDTFTSTTVATDTTPDAFTFTDATSVALGSVQTSNAVVISGINASAAITVTGGTYSVGCTASFTAAAGTITSGQTVCVRHTASASPATDTNTTLTVGGVSDVFTSTTAAGLPPNGDEDNDGIPNAVELVESRNPLVKDNDVFGNPRLFAMQQYRDFLGREGEAGGIQFYIDLLNNGTADRIAIIESFLLSPEFQNGLPSVTRLYFSFFNRIPDYGGLTFQLQAFRSGTTLDVIAQNFYNSPEFTNTYGALTNDQYINLVYQNVLGRAPDPDGYNFYITRLNNGTLTKGEMMIGFSESQEFQNITSNESFVIGVYVGLLKRTPEASGLDFYVDLLDGGTARRDIIPGFFNSPEYHNRFLP